MGKELEHTNDCHDCKVYEFERKMLQQNKEWMENNIRNIIREELHNSYSNNEQIESINWVLGLVTVGKRKVYVIPIMAIIAFTMVVVDFYITYLKR